MHVFTTSQVLCTTPYCASEFTWSLARYVAFFLIHPDRCTTLSGAENTQTALPRSCRCRSSLPGGGREEDCRLLASQFSFIVWLYLQKKHEKGSPDSQVTSGISDLTGELNRLRLAVRFGDCQSATIMDQLDGISWMDPAICWVQFCPDACRQRPDRKRKTTRETATAHPL